MIAFALTSVVQAAPDPAYVKQQVAETINGSMNNANAYPQEDLQHIVNNAYSNSEKLFKGEAQQLGQSANAYLNSDNSKRDQAWASQTSQDLVNKKEYEQTKQVGKVLCDNTQKYSIKPIECNNP